MGNGPHITLFIVLLSSGGFEGLDGEHRHGQATGCTPQPIVRVPLEHPPEAEQDVADWRSESDYDVHLCLLGGKDLLRDQPEANPKSNDTLTYFIDFLKCLC